MIRRGINDLPAWNASRVRLIKMSEWTPAAVYPIELWTFPEACHFTGIGRNAGLRVFTEADAYLLDIEGRRQLLFSGLTLAKVRKAIAARQVWIRRDSLKRPRYHAAVVPARHRNVESLSLENERLPRHRKVFDCVDFV